MSNKHQWLRSARIFALESWWPPFWPHLEVDWDRVLWTMRRLHLDTLQANALTKWACFPTQLIQSHPELGERDLLQEAQSFCEKHHFRWIIYSLLGHAMPISSQISKGKLSLYKPVVPITDSKPIGHVSTVPDEFQDYYTVWHFGGERYIAHCAFAAKEWLLKFTQELADRYDYQAAWFDGSVVPGNEWIAEGALNICSCSVCQEAYEYDFQAPFPVITDLADPRLLILRQWTARRMQTLVAQAAEIITHKRQIPLIGNMRTAFLEPNPDLVSYYDGGLFEHVPDRIALIHDVSEARRLVDVPIFYPDCYDSWPRKVTSGWELENKGLTILSQAALPYLAMPGKYYYDESNDQPAARIFEFIKNHETLISSQEPFAYAAVASLARSAPPEDRVRHVASAQGWIGALLDEHIPLTSLPSFQLKDPTEFETIPVLILPDFSLLAQNEIDSLEQYVREGGGLYIDGDPGYLDDKRERGEYFGEKFDLKWIPFNEMPADTLARRLIFERDAPGGDTYDIYLHFTGLTLPGFPLPGEHVLPSWFGQTIPGASWVTVANLQPTDQNQPLFPALSIKQHGKGRIVFSSISWGRQYEQRRDPLLSSWLKEVILWLGAQSLPVFLTANRLINLGLTELENGWLVFLINQSNDIQSPRLQWRELMKVAASPLAVGSVELVVPQQSSVQTIYGPSPDAIRVENGNLVIRYGNFQEHVVLHLTSQAGRKGGEHSIV